MRVLSIDQGGDCPDRIAFRNPVLKLLCKKHALRSLFPLDESAYPFVRRSNNLQLLRNLGKKNDCPS